MDILLFSANAVLPIVLLTFLGYFLRKTNFVSDSFLTSGNKVVFNICLPAMMFYNIYNIQNFSDLNWSIVLFSLAAVIVLILLAMVFSASFVKERACRGVVIQCIYRSNFGIIGLPLALSIGGADGAAVAAVISAFVVPLYNILAIIVLSMYSSDGADVKKPSFTSVFKKILRNPQIIAVGFAIIVLFVRSFIPRVDGELVFSIQDDVSFIYKMIEDANKASPFLSLVILGGMLQFDGIGEKLCYIVFGTVGRTFVAPIIGLFGAYACSALGIIHCGPAEYAALIALFGSPVAFSSAIMAEEMGGDGDLARQLVLWSSVVSAVSLFVIISLCKMLGML